MKPAEASLPSDTEVLVKRSFDAPVKLVWRAYMEPDLLRRWCSGQPGWSMPVCEMDLRSGGQYRWRWRSEENGQEFGFTGEVLEVVPHARIVHTQIFDPGELGFSMGSEPSIVTVTFQEADGITNVATTIRYASKADRDAAFATGMTDGMEMNYKQLDDVLAEGVQLAYRSQGHVVIVPGVTSDSTRRVRRPELVCNARDSRRTTRANLGVRPEWERQ